MESKKVFLNDFFYQMELLTIQNHYYHYLPIINNTMTTSGAIVNKTIQ